LSCSLRRFRQFVPPNLAPPTLFEGRSPHRCPTSQRGFSPPSSWTNSLHTLYWFPVFKKMITDEGASEFPRHEFYFYSPIYGQVADLFFQFILAGDEKQSTLCSRPFFFLPACKFVFGAPNSLVSITPGVFFTVFNPCTALLSFPGVVPQFPFLPRKRPLKFDPLISFPLTDPPSKVFPCRSAIFHDDPWSTPFRFFFPLVKQNVLGAFAFLDVFFGTPYSVSPFLFSLVSSKVSLTWTVPDFFPPHTNTPVLPTGAFWRTIEVVVWVNCFPQDPRSASCRYPGYPTTSPANEALALRTPAPLFSLWEV